PLPGAATAPKKADPASAPKKTAKAEPEPTKTTKSKTTSKSATKSSKLTERAKAMAKEKSRAPAAPRDPDNETINAAGHERVSTIRKNSAGTKECICPDVPFDGMVKND